MLRKILTLLFVIIFSTIHAQVPVLSDSSRISLITNSPWSGEVYALFGHTALRVTDKANNIDYVFNYGLFDFDSPNFMYRFAKGETDYMVGYAWYDRYIVSYIARGIDSYEQVLNLTPEEKQGIWKTLLINSLPENREYRYNFLYDNCSTRPRDIIENNINGKIVFTPTGKQQTFRNLIHECTGKYRWVTFGIDLVIGNEADKPVTDYQKMFLPLYLKNGLDGAVIISANGNERKLVIEENKIPGYREGPDATEKETNANQPFITGCILLLFAFAVSYLTYRRIKLPARIYDILLFTIAGITGCVIAFLMFFSEHPATNLNWNIVWLNPLQLIIAILIPLKYFSRIVYCYHFINFAALSIFLITWYFIPQQLEMSFIPFILALWLRSGMNFIDYKLNNKKVKTEKNK